MMATIPRRDPLAKRKIIDLRELAEHQFILYPRAVRPSLADAVTASCKEAGFAPRVRQYAPQLSSTINLVVASLGISIVPKSMKGLQPRAVAYVSLRGQPIHSPLSIAQRSGETSAAVVRFVNTARQIGRGRQPAKTRRRER
jgi:DNA-binding transcriptional LysR family regulator